MHDQPLSLYHANNESPGFINKVLRTCRTLALSVMYFKCIQFILMITYVQVSINLYDKNDSQVGSTLANVNNLEPGKTWNFEAPVMEQNVASYKIVEVTGF